MNPPPPMFPASGWTTARAKPTPTAASTALPPCRRISLPTSLAIGLPDTTKAVGASTTRALPPKVQEGATPATGLMPEGADAGAAGRQEDQGQQQASSRYAHTSSVKKLEGGAELPRTSHVS